jgi:hypothetical protein
VLAILAVAGSAAASPAWVRWLLAQAPEIRGTETLVALVPLFITQIRLALDLAHDAISYIHHGCERGRRLLQRTRSGAPPHVNPMRARFRVVVDHLVKDRGVRKLVVVAHSQGSVIALDELAQAHAPELSSEVQLVTVGSPITHLYQHYFPNVYPGWSDPKWDLFFARVTHWVNLYRLGDYVGTRVQPPGRAPFQQQAIGPGSHTGYWRDPRLVAALAGEGLFAPRPAAAEPDR